MSKSKQIVPGVDSSSTDRVKGLWVSEGSGMIGLVEEKGIGGHLIVWDDTHRGGLPLAITANGIQIPHIKVPQGRDDYEFIEWGVLFEMVEAFKASKKT